MSQDGAGGQNKRGSTECRQAQNRKTKNGISVEFDAQVACRLLDEWSLN